MKALMIAAGLFFSIFGAVIAYYAASDPGHEYDMEFVLPIDARQMPVASPAVQSSTAEDEARAPASEGRAEAGKAAAMPDRPPVEFGERPGAASEAQLQK